MVKSSADDDGRKLVVSNRKARHEYHVLQTHEAGMVLQGTEVKSLRTGNATIKDGYASLRDGELWLLERLVPEELGELDACVESGVIRADGPTDEVIRSYEEFSKPR